MSRPAERSYDALPRVTLFLCGDVMTGRGIDQILPHPGKPELYEPYMRSAWATLRTRKRRPGPMAHRSGFDYIWGDAWLARCGPRPAARHRQSQETPRPPRRLARKGITIDAPATLLPSPPPRSTLRAGDNVLGTWDMAASRKTPSAAAPEAGHPDRRCRRDSAKRVRRAVISWTGRDACSCSLSAWRARRLREWAPAKSAPRELLRLSADSAHFVARRTLAARQPGTFVVVSIHWGSN